MSGHAWPSDVLVRAAQHGDSAAIATVIEGSHPHVRRFAQSLCLTDEDAEDAAQEALLILYSKVGTLRASAALASWMFRIVRHECLRRVARARRQLPLVVDDAGEHDTTESAESEALARIEAAVVAEAIAALPADQRRVLMLRDVHGYSGAQVARHLGLTVPAMKSRLHRARATLRDTLARA